MLIPKSGFSSSKKKYALGLRKETNKLGYRTSGVLVEQILKIGGLERFPLEKTQDQILVEKLIYLSHTRFDVAYVVSVVSQFMHDPRERHKQIVDNFLILQVQA